MTTPRQQASTYIFELMSKDIVAAHKLLQHMSNWLNNKISDKRVIVLYGNGGNGKSTFLKVLGRMRPIRFVTEKHHMTNSDEWVILPEPDYQDINYDNLIEKMPNTIFFILTNNLHKIKTNYPCTYVKFNERFHDTNFELSDEVVAALEKLANDV